MQLQQLVYFELLNTSTNYARVCRSVNENGTMLYPILHLVRQLYTVAYRGGVWGVQPPPPPKFRSFDKAEPNSQFRGKYIRNNLTRIRLSLIFWVVGWKALPASYDQHSCIFFSLQGIKYKKLRTFYHMKWNFLYQITAASWTPD